MPTNTAQMDVYQRVEQRFTRLSRIGHMLSIGKWDEAVNMPAGGGQARAAALAELASIRNELLQDAQLGDDINRAAEATDLNPWQQANLREIKRIRDRAVAIPLDLEQAFDLATIETEQAWRALRQENNWSAFQPLLDNVVRLTRERAACLAECHQCEPYEALMQLYQGDFSRQEIDDCFTLLKSQLPSLLQQIREKQQSEARVAPLIPIKGNFDIAKQRQLSATLMAQLGFDFNHGRLDVTHHPFCGGVPQDTRINTRYYQHDFTEALMATIHETGHGRYEQGLPAAWLEQPVGQSRGMAIHESQSLLFEMQIGRSAAFLTYLQPQLEQCFAANCETEGALSLHNLLRSYQQVEPGLIRTSADEVSYPLHIILRYDIEKELLQGDLLVQDIPERWDQAMQAFLGLSTRNNFKDGCMQDVHWPSGAIGYFPFYTLGALLAAQLKHTLDKACADLDGQLMRGDLSQVSQWLNQNLWQKGCLLSSKQLIEHTCGNPLSADYFLLHLRNRYLNAA